MKRKKMFSQKEFNRIYSLVPRVCVDLLLKSDNKILLTKRKHSPYIGQWHIPGGTVFLRESFEDVVNRIAMEELGVHVTSKKMSGVIEFLKEGQNRHGISIVFEITTDEKPKEGKFFNRVPKNTIFEQKDYLINLGL